MAINAFKRRLTAQDIPGFAGGTLEDELARQQQRAGPAASGEPRDRTFGLVYDKTRGGFDQYNFEKGQLRPGERPQDAIRRSDLQSDMTRDVLDPESLDPDQGIDPTRAVIARPGEEDDRSPLDRRYVAPTGNQPEDMEFGGMPQGAQQNAFKRRLVGAQPSIMGDAPPPEVPQQPQERPRMVNPQPPEEVVQQSNLSQMGAPPAVSAFKQRLMQTAPQPNASGMIDFRDPGSPPVSMNRDRRTQPRDYVSDDSQFLRDVQSKPLSFRDKLGLVSQNIATNLGGKPLQTRRQREEAGAAGQLGHDLAIQKEQTARDLSEMVPIQLPDGTWTKTPAKNVATLSSRNQDQLRRLAETRRRNDAYVGHLNDLPKEKQAEAARKIFMSGIADGNPELKADLAKRMGFDEELPDTDKGTIHIDASGNMRVVHGRTGVSRTVTDETTGDTVGSWNAAQFKEAEAGRNQRAQARNAQSERNATIIAGGQVARMGDPEVHRRNMTEIDQDIDGVEKETDGILARQADTQKGGFLPTDPATLNQLRQRKNALERERRDEREKLGKIESAQGNLESRSAQARKAKPGAIQPNEDPQIRDYANKHFGGDYKKALAAARKTGYNK